MRSFRRWAAVVAVVLAGCGDGSIQSPDFTVVTTVEQLDIVPGVAQSLPAGTVLRLDAEALVSQTVPPGTRDANGNPITHRQETQTVTSQAQWTSSNTAVARVDRGVVTAVAPGVVTISASFEGLTDTVDVTVTDAVLQGVEYVKPDGTPRATNNTYSVISGSIVPFEIYGRFSDGSVRRLVEGTGANQFQVTWSSDDTGVATNGSGGRTFTTNAVGTAAITGQVTNVTGLVPDAASATLEVREVNAFCASEFRAPAAVASGAASAACLGCSVEQPELVIDGDLDTFATMNITAGLLFLANTSLTVYDTTTVRITPGSPTGFVVSRPFADLVSAELLSSLTVETLQCNAAGACTVVESFSVQDNALLLSLLGFGLVGDDATVLISTPPVTTAANGLRLTFDGGLVNLLSSLRVNTACGVAIPPAP